MKAMEPNAPRKPIVLLTGFGPFPGTPDNASAKLVEHLAQKGAEHFPHIEIRFDVLPTEWQSAPERLAQLYQDVSPDVALHFGVSNLSRGFTLETIARNACCTNPDATGCTASGPTLIPGAESEKRTRLPIEAIRQRLEEQGIPVDVSESAGTYLCNAIFYHCLLQARPDTIAGFIHIPDQLSPTVQTKDGLSWEAAVSGTVDIIGACLQTLAHKTG